jgi:hypothetical protein
MPLVVVEGQVLYRRPKKEELPKIGSMYFANEIRIERERDKHCRELSKSMSLIQKALLKGKKNVLA